jgi:putative DNA primase/helicase
MSSDYTKRTVAAKTTPIPIPLSLKPEEYLQEQRERRFPSDYTNYFYVEYMAVEGDNKLVIRHARPRWNANNHIIVNLTGYWNEYEKPEIENWFDSNFCDVLDYCVENDKDWISGMLEDSKKELISYLYGYFHNEPTGKRIMEMVRARDKAIQQKLERQEAPKADKIIRETAEHILSKHHIVTVVETDEMLYYKHGVYVPGAEAIIEEECEAMFEYDMSNHLVEEIKGHIKRKTHRNRDEFDSDLYVINFKNCLYHIKYNAIRDHTPEYLSLNQKPIPYIVSVKPKLFGKFLTEVLYPTQIRTMVELFAYTFYRANPHEIFANQFGYGSNGKSVMMATLKALHGPKNSSNIPLKHLINDKFAAADLEGKDVNVDDEASPGTIFDITKLKKLTGNEPSWIQRKNQQPYEARLHAKHFFTSNELPDFADTSEGRYRREIVIAYPNKFVRYTNPNNPEEHKEDPYLESKLTTEEELTGIASICMMVLRRILFQQDMRIHVDVRSIEERRKHRQLITNHMPIFVDQVIDSYSGTSEDIIYKDDLYKIYNRFCQLNKVPPLGKSAFSEKLKGLLGCPDRLRDGKEGKPEPGSKTRRKYWKGITIKEGWKNSRDGYHQKSLLLIEEDNDIIIEEETERPLRPPQIPDSTPLQLEENHKNSISSDIPRSESANISSDTTNEASQDEVKTVNVRT